MNIENQGLDKDLLAIQGARTVIKKAKSAQKIFSSYSQERVDSIVNYVANSLYNYSEELAKLAHDETGFGKWEDKVVKNTFATKFLVEKIRNLKTIGIINDDKVNNIKEIAVPLGVIAALTPSTNATSTIIYKALISLKSANAIIFSIHPNAKKCGYKTIDLIKKALSEVNAPEGIVDVLPVLSLNGTNELMKHKDVALILATGGEAMVKAAYNSGTPTISGGPGNNAAFIDVDANIEQAVKDIITSKTFDNGVICASEQSIVVDKVILEKVVGELIKNHVYFLDEEESKKIASILYKNKMINPASVGKSASVLAKMVGFNVPENTTVLISIQTTVNRDNIFSREKLCPILALYVINSREEALNKVNELLNNEGAGHTCVIHTDPNNQELINKFALMQPVYRILVNTPSSIGGIGGTTNVFPALTLGCGAVGHGSSSDNVSPMNLINIRKVGYGVRTLQDLNINATKANNQAKNYVDELLVKDNESLSSLATSNKSDYSADDIYSIINKVISKNQ